MKIHCPNCQAVSEMTAEAIAEAIAAAQAAGADLHTRQCPECKAEIQVPVSLLQQVASGDDVGFHKSLEVGSPLITTATPLPSSAPAEAPPPKAARKAAPKGKAKAKPKAKPSAKKAAPKGKAKAKPAIKKK